MRKNNRKFTNFLGTTIYKYIFLYEKTFYSSFVGIARVVDVGSASQAHPSHCRAKRWEHNRSDSRGR